MESKAWKETMQVHDKLKRICEAATIADARALRRAALTLHRWYEHECKGTIQRDEVTGKPYWYSELTHKRVSLAADRENGAMNTISRICRRLNLYHYLQTDPRGGTLYVDMKEIAQDNYNRATYLV